MLRRHFALKWLRGLDLNQRPLGYEYNTAMSGNPLIFRKKRSALGSSTFSLDVSCLLLFRPVSGCYGSKMGADSARCVRHEPALGVRCPPGQRFVYSDFPLAACPFKRNVLGNSPSPQILNDPKSLYHRPSGASGSDSRQALSLYKSSAVIWRSANRSKRCS